MNQTADVVVIGAGVHGASTAFHLARAGAGRVVVVDKFGVASGPTAKSGAMMRPIFTEAPYIQLVMEATEMMERWDEVVGGDAGFVERGFLRFTLNFSEADLGGNLHLMKQLGVQFEILDVGALRSRVPDAEFRGDEQGLWLARAGYADPVLTTRTLARAAERLGVKVHEGVQVTGLRASGSRIEAVETDQGVIHTRTVVNCAGPWSARLAAGSACSCRSRRTMAAPLYFSGRRQFPSAARSFPTGSTRFTSARLAITSCGRRTSAGRTIRLIPMSVTRRSPPPNCRPCART